VEIAAHSNRVLLLVCESMKEMESDSFAPTPEVHAKAGSLTQQARGHGMHSCLARDRKIGSKTWTSQCSKSLL
jgi:hypothetical protein